MDFKKDWVTALLVLLIVLAIITLVVSFLK